MTFKGVLFLSYTRFHVEVLTSLEKDPLELILDSWSAVHIAKSG